jgi:uncharacterized membrane protein YraQ (UPF0718 family)
MKIAKNLILAVVILFSFLSVSLFATTAVLADTPPCSENCASNGGPSGSGAGPNAQQLSGSLKKNPVVRDLNDIVSFLGAGVGVIVVGTLILGGIQYSLAGDSADAVSKAKQRITNGLIALVAYLLIFGFLQWIIPGGLFNS